MKKITFIIVLSLLIAPLFPFSETNAKAATDPLYNLIYQGIVSYKDSISLGKYGTSREKIYTTYQKVLDDHPEIFFLNNTYRYNVSSEYSSGYFYPSYSFPKAQIATMKTELDKKVASVSNNAKKLKSELDRVLYIHDYIVNNTTYDYGNYLSGTIPQSSYSVYGALIGKKAVCDGYAKAAKLLLNKSGIWAVKVTGYANKDLHAWNQVRVDGNYYYMDITWNDPVYNDMRPILSYNYFLVPESQLSRDHAWNKSGLKKATSMKYKALYSAKDFIRSGSYIYYSNEKDQRKLYRMTLTGSGNKKISNTRMYSLELLRGALYFSNLSDYNRLYKMKLNGTGLKKLTNAPAYGLYVNGSYLHYTNQNTKKAGKLKVY
ncbi:DUF5050 domain-containing protein [Peribacillus sp. SCS-155]|uniref:DUF5050 domain-containing protein n=1 Tax=Peribacillus sedimenti TaxID=3115297 RepID=UPI0039064E2E